MPVKPGLCQPCPDPRQFVLGAWECPFVLKQLPDTFVLQPSMSPVLVQSPARFNSSYIFYKAEKTKVTLSAGRGRAAQVPFATSQC